MSLVRSSRVRPKRTVQENPMGAADAVTDFVVANPWLTVAVAAGGVLAAAGVAAWALSRPTAAAAATTTTPPSSSSTSSSSSTTSSSSSTPSYSAATAVTVYAQSAGKYVPVGASLAMLDASTGQPIAGTLSTDGVLAPGPTAGTYVAIAAGTVKITTAAGSFTAVVQPATGTAGVARRVLGPAVARIL
jgi:hypothetical protein